MKKILFIEDERELIEAYRQKFSKKYFVDFAMEGEEGLKKAKEWQPDLIILDILIPGATNGVGVLKELKSEQATKLIPVFVLTNLEGQEETVNGLGAVGCLVKANVGFDVVSAEIEKIVG